MVTTVVKSIGSAGGRDYGSIQAWIAATSVNLVSADQVQIGELYNDSIFQVFDFGTQLVIAGATTDATRYRVLRAATGQRYDPVTRVGAQIVKTMGGAGFGTGITVNEDNSRIEGGFAILATGTVSSATNYGVRVTANNVRVEQMFVRYDKGTGTADLTCFSAGGSITGAEFRNCIAMGSGVSGVGARLGFGASVADGTKFYNCAAHNIQGPSATGGIVWSSSINVDVRNCIATNSAGFGDFAAVSSITAFFTNCISSDATATGANSFTGQPASSIYNYPDYEDFRPISASKALDHGAAALFSPFIDITGATRVGLADIGPYEGVFLPSFTLPTDVIKTVGAGDGLSIVRDYTTLALWEAATRQNLVSGPSPWGNTRQIAELYPDADFDLSSTGILLDGAVCDSTRYRVIRAAPGQRYSPITGRGVLLKGTSLDVVKITEPYSRIEGVRIDQNNAGAPLERHNLTLDGKGTRADGIYAVMLTGTGNNRAAVRTLTGTDQIITNSIAIGPATPGTGPNRGFSMAGVNSAIYNCLAYRISQGANGGDGIRSLGGGPVTNCQAFDCLVGFNATGVLTYNAASDATPGGTGSHPNLLASDTFQDAAAGDFRLKATSVLVNAGANLSGIFKTDFDGNNRTAPWEISPWNGFAVEPLWPRTELISTGRLCVCWACERIDGFSLYVTDHNRQINFNGQTYKPGPSFSASARRMESGLRESSVEVSGPVFLNGFAFNDLRAGFWRGALITEYYGVDWQYPWNIPQVTRRWIMEQPEYDRERFTAQLLSPTSKLRQLVGRRYNRTCDYTLGHPTTCGVNMVPLTTFAVGITTVINNRYSFNANGTLSGSHADGHFALGRLIWKTGNNFGVISGIKAYTQTGKIIELQEKTPFAISTSDTFDIEPGCDFLPTTCKNKFNNLVNIGAFEDIPGTSEALASPRQ